MIWVPLASYDTEHGLYFQWTEFSILIRFVLTLSRCIKKQLNVNMCFSPYSICKAHESYINMCCCSYILWEADESNVVRLSLFVLYL